MRKRFFDNRQLFAVPIEFFRQMTQHSRLPLYRKLNQRTAKLLINLSSKDQNFVISKRTCYWPQYIKSELVFMSSPLTRSWIIAKNIMIWLICLGAASQSMHHTIVDKCALIFQFNRRVKILLHPPASFVKSKQIRVLVKVEDPTLEFVEGSFT